MNIVIIEDERVLGEDLERSINKLMNEPVNIVQLRSVKESIAYLKTGTKPDLIFSDIQLGDGLSFEIFAKAEVRVPIIFCTAYNEYALDAFKVNGIDYILKPFTEKTLDRALNKYIQLKGMFSTNLPVQYQELMEQLSAMSQAKPSSILVYFQDKILPIRMVDIALFQLVNDTVHLHTFSGQTYYANKSLEELEKLTAGHFFRANRQFLVCRKSIIDASSFLSRTLSLNISIPINEKVTVSKGRVSAFLEWLAKTE